MSRHQVAIINIADASDAAVYLDGNYVISADPESQASYKYVETVANSLSAILNTPVKTIDIQPHDDWQWWEIEERLKKDGMLITSINALPQHVVIGLKGGLVESVATDILPDRQVKVAVLDFDIDGADEDELIEVKKGNKSVKAAIHYPAVDVVDDNRFARLFK